MKIAATLLVIIVFAYTAGFAVSLWREENKPGSFAVFLLAITLVVLPFFSVLR